MSHHEGNQVPGMPEAICHACGLGYECAIVGCPNRGRRKSTSPKWLPYGQKIAAGIRGSEMPETTPEDVQRIAHGIVAGYHQMTLGDDLTTAIACAIFSERKRATKIAEKWDGKPCGHAADWGDWERSYYDAGQTDASMSIAAAIRKGD